MNTISPVELVYVVVVVYTLAFVLLQVDYFLLRFVVFIVLSTHWTLYVLDAHYKI